MRAAPSPFGATGSRATSHPPVGRTPVLPPTRTGSSLVTRSRDSTPLHTGSPLIRHSRSGTPLRESVMRAGTPTATRPQSYSSPSTPRHQSSLQSLRSSFLSMCSGSPVIHSPADTPPTTPRTEDMEIRPDTPVHQHGSMDIDGLNEEDYEMMMDPDAAEEGGNVDAPTDLDNAFIVDQDRFVPVIPQPDAQLQLQRVPTTAELKQIQATEVRELLSARKSSKATVEKTSKGVIPVGAYTVKDQGFMALMKSHIYHDMINLGPWLTGEPDLIERAKNWASGLVGRDGDEIVTEEFQKTLMVSESQIRSSGLLLIRAAVGGMLDLEEGDVARADYLLTDDRFLFPEDSNEENLQLDHEMFNVQVMNRVIVMLLFETYKRGRIGVLFLDNLLAEEDPEDLHVILSTAAQPELGVGFQVPEIAALPAMMSGPSLGLIAFAAIHIKHAITCLKYPAKKAPEFGEAYNETWCRYVQELAKHPNLGQLRAWYLDSVK
ncbi:hypothetical protein FRC06_010508 [Ceratobasidium sp. 370]|nr:hypothetical protein FRC06_010508 [Ceratobasidium sp. 370]